MKKKSALLIAAAFVTSLLFGGCEIDVNKLAGNNSENENNVSAVQSIENDTSKEETDTDVDVSQPEVYEESEGVSQNDSAFDTSAYKTVYVTGSATIPVIKDEKENSKVIGTLSFGDSVSFINSSITEYSFVYSETLSAFGYIEDIYLVDDYSEVSHGQIYYSKTNSTQFFSDENGVSEIRTLSKNEGVTVIAMLGSGMWRVSDSKDTIGYVSSLQLSDEKITDKTGSKSTDKNDKDKNESKTESKTESKSESKTESKKQNDTVDGRVVGEGEAPTSGYTVYIVDVDVDYLALRSRPSSDNDYIIGSLYYEEQVYVLDTSSEYWYIYAPTLGMYGFVRGNSDYLYPAVY